MIGAKKDMIIGAFDQAPVGIGWVYGAADAEPVFGYHANPNYGDNSARLASHVFDWATNHFKSCAIDSAWCEQIVLSVKRYDANVIDRQYTVRSAIQVAAAKLGLLDSCYEVLIAEWRREFYRGGRPVNGATWKELAVAECHKRGWLTDNHHVAEALGIWHFARCCTDKRWRK